MTVVGDVLRAPVSGRTWRELAHLAVRVLLAVAALVVVAYGILYAVAGDRVPRGTTVEGVAIGGLEPKAAEERLRDALAPRTRTPIVVTADGTQRSVDPSDAGVERSAGRWAAAPDEVEQGAAVELQAAPAAVVHGHLDDIAVAGEPRHDPERLAAAFRRIVEGSG